MAVLFAKLIDSLFEKHFSLANHAVIGLVLASTLMIIPRSYASFGQFIGCLALAVVGFGIAWWLGEWGEKVRPQE